MPLKRISELHLTVNLNYTSNSISILQEQNAMCNIPTFTARNQMSVAATQGELIPQKVFKFSLTYISAQSLCSFYVTFHQIVPDMRFFFQMFRFLHGSMKIKVRVLLAILLMYKHNQIRLEMVLA